ncbi:SpoIID/LytB domain-containing protein [Isoptericola hypogeus]|uniref:SpoIID/LytB domain-containing protein n=1 Tax=Isoptericola hypogeus TaxID=300179 RepID=UPI0031E0B519
MTLATARGPLRVLAAVVSLALALAVLVATPAEAATWSLRGSGGGTTTALVGRTLFVQYLKDGRPAAGAPVMLQRKDGTTWVTERTLTTGSAGTASMRVRPTSDRTYRFRTASTTSTGIVVRVVPARFEMSGSGFGHGVGMAQWGAYQLAREGRTAAQILGYYYPGTRVSTANDPRTTLDVQVLGPPADSGTNTVLSLGSGAWRLKDGAGTVVASGGATRRVTVHAATGGVTATVTENGTTRATVSVRPTLVLEWTGTRYYDPTGTKAVATVTGAHGTYRNGRLVVTNVSSRVNVVNEVVINTEYLYGIDEMPSGWGAATNRGAAALQAQAVAARNYAIVEKVKGRKPECGCHVYDDTRSQHYVGWKKEGGSYGATWKAAVDATLQDGTVTVLRDAGGGFAETPYFASSGAVGGRQGTASNAEVFGTTALPYLKHVSDPWSASAPGNPYLRWSDSISQQQARAIFGADVRSVAVTARWSSGQVRTVTATTASGTKVSRTRTADGWRTTLGVAGSWVVGFSGRVR